ncbi:MAG: sugar diacid utilization regulator SdaR [Clostridia bacterium]|nr:sugar diacid utilization regulator SdaR [Clostridia bacterium]NCC45051.1 sugar diacid utilization regulator SdaR [Clostridia bacterium]
MITSIDKPLAQQIVNTVKDVCGQNINFIDCSGIIFASTDEKRIGTFHEIGHKAAATGTAIEVNTDNSFLGTQKGINLPIYHNHSIFAVIGISGDPEEVRKYAYLAERITNLLIRERELNAFSRTQADKKNFIIQSLISSEPKNQEYLKDCLSDFGVPLDTKKRLILIRINARYNPTNIALLEQKIQQMFSMFPISLYTFNYPNEYLAVIDSKVYDKNPYVLKHFASLQQELLKVSIGKSCSTFHLESSYISAVTAMKSIANTDKNFVVFDDLTLEIILSSMNEISREEYLSKTTSALSAEEMDILKAYFEEEMSLQATSSKLFIHKNTLQYKLNRIHEKTGMNPRRFQDAVLLYLALKLSDDFPIPANDH